MGYYVVWSVTPALHTPALHTVVADDVLRRRLGVGAMDHAAKFTWDTTARGTLAVMASEALRKR